MIKPHLPIVDPELPKLSEISEMGGGIAIVTDVLC
jgi:hypothetical protein